MRRLGATILVGAVALVLEVKGDFCYAVRVILDEAGRSKDYLEIGLAGPWQ